MRVFHAFSKPFSYRDTGYLIHFSRDDWGVIEVIEDQGIRSLHFGSRARQSACRVGMPAVLELSYARAMIGCLLFRPNPQRILIAGLGGGSLPSFLLSQLPNVQIEVVEIRTEVVNVARKFFGLPDNRRLNVHIGDISEFLKDFCNTSKPVEFGSYEIIMFDIFEENGLPKQFPWVDTMANAYRALGPNGVLVLNLWDNDKRVVPAIIDQVRRYFQQDIFKLSVPGKTNEIYFASKLPLGTGVGALLKARSATLEVGISADLRRFAREIRRV